VSVYSSALHGANVVKLDVVIKMCWLYYQKKFLGQLLFKSCKCQ
jgi:hypothetical protein